MLATVVVADGDAADGETAADADRDAAPDDEPAVVALGDAAPDPVAASVADAVALPPVDEELAEAVACADALWDARDVGDTLAEDESADEPVDDTVGDPLPHVEAEGLDVCTPENVDDGDALTTAVTVDEPVETTDTLAVADVVEVPDTVAVTTDEPDALVDTSDDGDGLTVSAALEERLGDDDPHAVDVMGAVKDDDAVALALVDPAALALEAPDRVPDPPDPDGLPVELGSIVAVRDARADDDALGVRYDDVVADGTPE